MKLFIFPLGESVLHPGTSKPLNIFEPRYLKMVEDAVAEKVPIALGFIDRAVMSTREMEETLQNLSGPENEEKYFAGEAGKDRRIRKGQNLDFVLPIVGYGHPEILERRSDGTMLIALPGEGKAKLGPVMDDRKPYIVTEAEPISETYEIDLSQALQYLNLQRRLVKWMGEHIVDEKTRNQFIAALTGPQQVIGAITAFLLTDSDMQQMVLESNDVNEKINLLMGILITSQYS